jgi:hypothetical protein
VRLARRAGRYARYQQGVELTRQGRVTQEIAECLGMSDRTVRDWLKRGTFPEAHTRRKRQSPFDVCAPSVLKRGPRGRAQWASALARTQGPGLHRNGPERLPPPENPQAS